MKLKKENIAVQIVRINETLIQLLKRNVQFVKKIFLLSIMAEIKFIVPVNVTLNLFNYSLGLAHSAKHHLRRSNTEIKNSVHQNANRSPDVHAQK